MNKPIFLSLGLALAFCAGDARAQGDNALIDLLVRKKILTQKEAQEVRAELVEEKAATSADKLKLSGPVTELALYGDVRMRYQYDNLDPQFTPAGPEHGMQRSRWRFRLRLNADFKLTDNWFGGVQIQTNNQSDSGFQTYVGGFRNYEIYVSRAYFGWNATDWLTVVAGKQPNPFYTTELVWDQDINPSGVVETVRFHKLFAAGGGENSAGYSKDGKAAAPAPRRWELTLLAGQFFFDDNNEDLFDNDLSTDAYLFEEQLIFSYRFTPTVKFTIAPAYLAYTAAKLTNVLNSQPFTSPSDGLPAGVGETRDLSLIQLPGDLSFKLAGWNTKFFWDATYNTAGSKRTHDIYGLSSHSSRDDFSYLLGLQIGENKKKGDWSLFVNYRQVGLAAVDPNLNDSDWGLSRVNLRGWKGGVAYNFTDAVLGSFAYGAAWNIRKNLIGGQATGGASIADANAVQVLQLELNVKF